MINIHSRAQPQSLTQNKFYQVLIVTGICYWSCLKSCRFYWFIALIVELLLVFLFFSKLFLADHRISSSSFQACLHPTCQFGQFQSLMVCGPAPCHVCFQIQELLCCISCLEVVPHKAVQNFLIHLQNLMAALHIWCWAHHRENEIFCLMYLNCNISCCLLCRTELSETGVHE